MVDLGLGLGLGSGRGSSFRLGPGLGQNAKTDRGIGRELKNKIAAYNLKKLVFSLKLSNVNDRSNLNI